MSDKDLIAPFHEKERSKHHELCELLKNYFGTVLSIEDFCCRYEQQQKPLYHFRPLSLARVEQDNGLMVNFRRGCAA